ncbi:MAG TPA: RNA polymerase sigma factor [Longimicrobium sp.]
MAHGSKGRPDRPGSELDRELIPLILQVVLFAETARGIQAFERLAIILTRPVKRIARASLEAYLPPEEINQDDIDEIANEALFRVYRAIPGYRPEAPVIPWVAVIVRRLVIDWIRRERHTRVPNAPKFVPLNEDVYLIAAPDDGVDDRLSIERLTEGLPPVTRDVVRLASDGHSAVDIAKRVARPAWWVRSELKKLRPRFGR